MLITAVLIASALAADPANLESFVRSSAEHTKAKRVELQKQLTKLRNSNRQADRRKVQDVGKQLRAASGNALIPIEVDESIVGSVGTTNGIFASYKDQLANDTAEIDIYYTESVQFIPPGTPIGGGNLYESATATRGPYGMVDEFRSRAAVLQIPGQDMAALSKPIKGEWVPSGVSRGFAMPKIVEVTAIVDGVPSLRAVPLEELKPFLNGKKIIGLK